MDNSNIIENNNTNEEWEINGPKFIADMQEDINRIIEDNFGMNYTEFTQLKDKISNAKGIYSCMSEKNRKDIIYCLKKMFRYDKIFTKKDYYKEIGSIKNKEQFKKNSLNMIKENFEKDKVKIEDGMKKFLDTYKHSFEKELKRYTENPYYLKAYKEMICKPLKVVIEIIENDNNCWRKLDKNQDKIFEENKIHRIKMKTYKSLKEAKHENLSSPKLISFDDENSKISTSFLDGLKKTSSQTPLLDGLKKTSIFQSSIPQTPLLDGLKKTSIFQSSIPATPLLDGLKKTSSSIPPADALANTSLSTPFSWENANTGTYSETNNRKRGIEKVDSPEENDTQQVKHQRI